MNVDEKELAALGEWLSTKLGRHFTYVAPDKSFDVRSGSIQVSDPCMIFSDGVVFAHLVRVLSYHKCSELDNVQLRPKSLAVKRNNVKKVLEFLRREKKILVDYVFLEDVLVSGDMRAVVLVLRCLKQCYKNHRTAHSSR